MIEQENLICKKLKVKFEKVREDKDNFIEAIHQINEEQHPIQHSFLKKRVSQLEND